MQLTREYIMKHRTARGAWTRAQIEALGLEWPPLQGWIDSVVGQNITEAQGESLVVALTVLTPKAGMRRASKTWPPHPDQLPLF